MDRQTGSLQGVYTNPIQAGEETDFWSRPLSPADQSPSPVRDGRESEQHPPQQAEQPEQPFNPFAPQRQETTPEQQAQPPQPDPRDTELAQLRQQYQQMQYERQQEERQRAFAEQQRKTREQRVRHRDQALAAVDQRNDLDDDQKADLKNVIKTNFDNLTSTVDQEFQQYNGQVEGAFKQITGPMFVAQQVQEAGINSPQTWQRIQDFGISAENIQQALPALRKAAESDRQLAQSQASQANAQQQQQGVDTVAGYGTSAPTGAEPEKGSHEHLESLLVGF